MIRPRFRNVHYYTCLSGLCQDVFLISFPDRGTADAPRRRAEARALTEKIKVVRKKIIASARGPVVVSGVGRRPSVVVCRGLPSPLYPLSVGVNRRPKKIQKKAPLRGVFFDGRRAEVRRHLRSLSPPSSAAFSPDPLPTCPRGIFPVGFSFFRRLVLTAAASRGILRLVNCDLKPLLICKGGAYRGVDILRYLPKLFDRRNVVARGLFVSFAFDVCDRQAFF